LHIEQKLRFFALFAGNIPAYLKKNDDRMPCAALLQIRNIVAFECPSRMLKLLGPEKMYIIADFLQHHQRT